MRRTCLVTMAVVVLALGAGGTAHAGNASFPGRWQTVDLDGSLERLRIVTTDPGSYYAVLRDKHATGCGGPVGIVEGPLQDAGSNLIEGTFRFECPNGFGLRGEWAFEYDPATDTLWDGYVTWYRH
jgi:hypothetical protein